MAKKSKKSKNGCVWFFVLCLLSFIGFVVINVFFQLQFRVSLFIALAIPVIFLSLILGKAYYKSLMRFAIILFIVLIGLKYVGVFLLDKLNDPNKEEVTFTPEEEITKTSFIEENDTLALYTSSRIWKDNYGNDYTANLSVRDKDYQRLKNHLNSYVPPSGSNFWGNLYDYIDRKDTPSLDLIMDAFTEINFQNKLNQMEFAEMVVSCIQDIPYSLVFTGNCESPENYEDSIKNILLKCPECCIGNIKYGIQNPVSFLQNLKGDCDTRTVLIYSILKHFNYDIAIVNSEYYRHSILGINLPASGLYKIHNGKKYILWETTAKYYEAGYLSPNYNNVTHWNVILTSK